MLAVIVGCGSLGAELATSLSSEGHNVIVVDKNPESFEQMGTAFDGKTIVGNATDIGTLRDARCQEADALAAVTSDDNINIAVAQIASRILKVPKVVARVFDPQREVVFKELGLSTVCPTLTGVDVIREVMLAGSVHRRFTLGAGEVSICEIPVNQSLAGKSVADIEIPNKLRVIAVTSNGSASILDSQSILKSGDIATVAVRVDRLRYLESLLSGGKGR